MKYNSKKEYFNVINIKIIQKIRASHVEKMTIHAGICFRKEKDAMIIP